MTLPFQLPISDSQCLASGSGWNLVHTFYAYIYIPIVVFLFIYNQARLHPQKSPKRFKNISTLIFLLTLYYSPVLKTIASVFKCVNDANGEWVVISDPSVSCETSTSRYVGFLLCYHLVNSTNLTTSALPQSQDIHVETRRYICYFDWGRFPCLHHLVYLIIKEKRVSTARCFVWV